MEQEIEIMDYINILFKNKTLILGFALIGLVVGAVAGYLAPDVYRTVTILEIGEIRKESIEFPVQIVERIRANVYEDPDLEESYYEERRIENISKTTLIKIDLATLTPDQAEDNLNYINDLIINQHNETVNSWIAEIRASISKLENDIPFLISRGQQAASLTSEKNGLEARLDDFKRTQVIQQPFSYPLESKIVRYLVFGFMAGTSLAIAFSFFQEWWWNNKHYFK